MSDPAVFLSLVLPFRDQADHAERDLRAYGEMLGARGRPYELIAVPNACVDETAAIVSRLSRLDTRIVAVENPRGGWGLSVRTGLAAARGGLVGYTNSARTDPADVVALMDLYLQSGAGLAKARREKRGAPARSLGSWLYNLEGRVLLGIRAGDVNGTPKILSRGLYERLRLTSDGDLLDMELLAKATRLGVRVVEMPVAGFARHGGRSRTGLASALRMYSGAWKLRREVSRFMPA